MLVVHLWIEKIPEMLERDLSAFFLVLILYAH